MLNVEQARKQTKGLQDTINEQIEKIDLLILEQAKYGKRFLETSGGGVGYNNDLKRHYETQGFKVAHYINPWDTLKIEW